jgi:hypothetical protein
MSSESVKLAAPYDWKRTLWKGLRPAVIAAGAAGLAAFAQSINVEWLVALGVPSVLAVFVAEAVRNYWKQHRV